MRTPSVGWCNRGSRSALLNRCLWNLLCKSEAFGEQTACVERLPKSDLAVHLQSCHLRLTSKILFGIWVTNDHRVCLSVCYLCTEVPHANFALLLKIHEKKDETKSVGKKTDCLVPSRWTDLRGFYIDECPLCKQTLACTNHTEGGEQFESPWRMSCIVWEYESPCSPIKPIQFPFTASVWRSPSLFFFCLVSAPTTSCVSVP